MQGAACGLSADLRQRELAFLQRQISLERRDGLGKNAAEIDMVEIDADARVEILQRRQTQRTLKRTERTLRQNQRKAQNGLRKQSRQVQRAVQPQVSKVQDQLQQQTREARERVQQFV